MIKIQPMSESQLQQTRLLRRIANSKSLEYQKASIGVSQEQRGFYAAEISKFQQFLGIADLVLRYGGWPVEDSPRQVITKSLPIGRNYYAEIKAEKIRQLAAR